MERLVKKAQAGDKDAFVRLMEENRTALYRAAKAILHQEEDVEDAVQETVCRAFYRLGGLRSPKYFKTWLTRILINCCYDLLRSQRGLVPLALLSEDRGEPGGEEAVETALDVRESLAALGENDRLILTLFYLNDLPVKEIARLLGISGDAVKARLYHGRKKFREAYGERIQEKEAMGNEG